VYKTYYRDRFREIFGEALKPGDGLGKTAVRAALARANLVIPAALFDYYIVAGRHTINQDHDRLRPIKGLEWLGDKLVFLEENQSVVYWAIDRAELEESDPIIWQGINGETIEWFAEGYRLSRSLMARWKWTITGVLEEPEGEPG
jgi:hypothetical protein